MILALGAVPAGFVVSLLGTILERPRRIAMAGLVISTITGLLLFGLLALAFCGWD